MHCLIEEVKAHVLLFLLLRLRLRGSRGSATAATRSGGGSSGEGLRVGQVVLDLLGQREGVVDLQGDGQHVLVAVDDRMGDGGEGGVADGHAQRGHVAHTGGELGSQVGLGDVEHLRGVDGAVLKHLHDDQAVAEGLDAELGQQGGLRGPHTLAFLDDRHVGGDLNHTLGNLGWDVERLEEGRLLRSKAGGAGGDVDVEGGEQTHTRGRTLLELGDLVTSLNEVAVGEDQAHIADHEGEQGCKLLITGALHVEAEAALHQRVLAHQNGGVIHQAQRSANLLELLGGDIVSMDQEGLAVLGQNAGELLLILLLLRGGSHGEALVLGCS
mmetsp:Transcript_25360/g.45200  ORF Transcript_25360/g.45200 Transcript_25360/m.45200 type:complete len:327 (-) Transcript_25360:124-1104(-)